MKAAFIRLPRGLIMITIVLLFLAILFCVRAFIINNSAADAMAPALFGKSVVIDPGHGGWDPGMKGSSGSIEATVNLEIAQKLAEYCRQAGAFVSMTRETDNALGDTKAEDMAARVDLTEEADADIFISIHCNSNVNPAINGTEVYVYQQNTQPYWLAQHVLQGIVNRVGTKDNGVRLGPSLYVLRRTRMPAILVELAYLSNESDAQKLEDDQYGFAQGIYNGMLSYFGFSPM